MVELEIKPKVDTGEATSSIDRLEKALGKLAELQEQTLKEQKSMNDNIQKSSKKTEKSLDDTAKATSGLAKGFKGVGLAIKAAGIVLVIGALSTLKDVFMQNQDVADTVATAFETVSIVFNQVVGSVVDSVKAVSEATNGFEALTKVASGLLTLAVTPLKAAFFGLKLGLQEAQLAWEESFLGDNDPTTIKELNKGIEQTKKDLEDVGLEAGQASLDIYNNFSNAIDEVSQVAVKSTENLKEVSISAAAEQASANVNLKNTAQLAAAEQQRIVEQYDRQAERLRQIRDLESNSLETRIAANEKLNEVLDEQEKALLKQADLQIASARAALEVNDTIENQVALTEALANREGVLAQVQGLRSEQQANINGLTREANQLNQTAIDGQRERELDRRAFLAEQEQNEEKRKEMLLSNIEFELEILESEFERKKQLYAEGTQARIDAEQDYLNRKQELSQEEIKIAKSTAKAEEKIEKSKEKTKEGLIQQGFEFAEKASQNSAQASKGVAAAEATFSTYSAIAAQLKSAAASPGGAIPGYAIAQAIITGSFGFAQVAKILSTPIESQSTPSIGSGGGASGGAIPSQVDDTPNIPNFDFGNQGVGGGQDAGLNRNYVILQEIKDAEAVDQIIQDKENSV